MNDLNDRLLAHANIAKDATKRIPELLAWMHENDSQLIFEKRSVPESAGEVQGVTMWLSAGADKEGNRLCVTRTCVSTIGPFLKIPAKAANATEWSVPKRLVQEMVDELSGLMAK